MIFFHTHEQVLSRDKTQTRRPKKPGDELRRTDGGIPYVYNTITKRIRYCGGRDYAVQPGRSKHGLGKIRLTDIRMEKLLDISIMSAMAEGILPEGTTRPDLPTEYLRGFILTWERLYKGTPNEWAKNPEVIVLEFELVERYDQHE